MLLRPLEQKDIANCAELFSGIFQAEPWNEPWTIQLAQTRLQHFFDSPGFVGIAAFDNAAVKGFVLGNTEPFHSGSFYYLREMCVSPELKRSGVGKALIHELEKTLHKINVQTIYLITEKEVPAAWFYRGVGFTLSQTTGFYVKRLGEMPNNSSN